MKTITKRLSAYTTALAFSLLAYTPQSPAISPLKLLQTTGEQASSQAKPIPSYTGPVLINC